jgi:hypothetical protein
MNTQYQNEPKPSQIDIPLFKDEQGKEQPFLYFANLKINTTVDNNFVIIQSPQDNYTQDEHFFHFTREEFEDEDIQDENEMMRQYHFNTNFLKTNALIAKTIIYRKDYDEEENENYKMVSYSVPNPCTLNVFNNLEIINGNLEQPTGYYYTEMVEGTMITLFHDGDKWEIATRSNIGGNYSYFQNKYELPINNLKNYEASLITEIFSGQVKTFQQMFYEALFNEELNGDFHEELNAKLTENNIFTDYCYTFVVQHPAHSFVAVFETPKIYLLSVSHIKQLDEEYDDWKYNITLYDAECMHHKNRNNYPFVKQLTDAFKSIKFPKQDFIVFGVPDKFLKISNDDYNFRTAEDRKKTFIEFFVEKYKNNPLNQNRQGIIVYSLQPNSDFKHRMMVFTDTYLHKMQLRTNHPNFQYTYFELLKNHDMGEFLYNFPQFQTLLSAIHTQFEKFVEVLFKLYKVYVANAKSKVKTPFPHKFHKHIIALHDLYKQKNYGTNNTNNKKTTKFIIDDNVVRNYLLGLEVSYLINSLNYEIHLQTQLPETFEDEDA